MAYCIYMHTNKINGKVYIGQTCKLNPKYRWGANGKEYRHQPKFYNAIKKYGWDNFKHEILEINLTREEANKKEQYYIKYFDSIKTGYNVQKGGVNTEAITPKKPVNQYDLNCNFIRRWGSVSEAGDALNIALGSIVKVCQHKLDSCGGYIWCYVNEEPKLKLLKTNAKTICQYDLDGNLIKKFKSQKEAAIEISGKEQSKSKICSCCKHTIKSALGFVWRYDGDPFSYQEDIHCTRKVNQLDLNGNLIKTWNSFADVYRELGIRQGNIYSCCVGKKKTTGGYRWEYYKE